MKTKLVVFAGLAITAALVGRKIYEAKSGECEATY